MGEAAKRKKLFRAPPPRDFIERVLRTSGLAGGLADPRWFSRAELLPSAAEDWLPELEAYYLPCKAVRFLHGGPMTADRLLTVFRHLLETVGVSLETQERSYHGAKQTLYRLRGAGAGVSADLSGSSLTVEFL